MASLARVLSVTRRGLRRQIQTSPATAIPLVVKLLREPESGVKIALDSEERLTPHRDASFWEPIVAELGSSSPRKAKRVLEWKLEKLLKDDVQCPEHYSKLISYCGKLDDIPLAMKIFTSMESRGVRPNSCIFNALVSACLSTGCTITAFSLFEIMERTGDSKPDLVTYNAFISMYSKLGDSHGMIGWYSAAKKAGLSPNTQTYEFLITGFVKCGKFDDANQFFKEMLSFGTSPNLTIFESLLKGLCNQKNISSIKELLKFVEDEVWQLSEPMVKKLLLLYSDLGRVEQMEGLLGLLNPRLHLGVLARVHCGIIRLYALADRLDDMENWVGKMLERGMVFTCPEDVEVVICSYFRQKAYDRLDLFLDRIKDSYKLARSSYDLLVAGYRKFELYERLELVIKDMKRDGFA